MTLYERYAAAHNEGVRSGDFRRLAALFHPEAIVRFEGLDVGPLQGTAAIEEAFRTSPPDDELELLGADADAVAYGWARRPGKRAGTLRLAERDGLIGELQIGAE